MPSRALFVLGLTLIAATPPSRRAEAQSRVQLDVIVPAGTLSSVNEPSSLVKLRIIGGMAIIIPPPLRDMLTPAWNAVTG